MKLLDRYLLLNVLGWTLTTLGILSGLALILLMLDEIDNIKGAYTFGKAVMFVIYTLPGYLVEFFPLATLLGSLMALGQLASGSEITAMRAAGLSLSRLARPVLAAGLVLGLAGMLLGETLGPLGQTEARLMRAEAMGKTLSIQGEQGLWAREGERFVHIAHVTPKGEVYEVRVFEFDADQSLRQAMFIGKASPQGATWKATDLIRHDFGTDSIEVSRNTQVELPALLPADLLKVVVLMPQYMSMGELWRYARFLDANGLTSDAYWLAWWGKLFTPLNVIAMLLLALPFALAMRRSGGAGQRLILGILLGLGLLIAARLLTQGGLLVGLPPMLAALGPTVLFLSLALIALRRQEFHHAV